MDLLQKIKQDTNDLIKSQIFPSISEFIELKIKEETGKYLDNTDILWDIFPKPIGNSLFRSCGNCHHCIGSPGGCSYFNDEKMIEEFNKLGFKINGLKSDEYILICSSVGFSTNINGSNHRESYLVQKNKKMEFIRTDIGEEVLITNYGSLIHLRVNKNDAYSEIVYKNIREYPLIIDEIYYYNKIVYLLRTGMLTQNNIRAWISKLNMVISMFDLYNPKVHGLYRIEKQKEEVKKMTQQLQEKETEIIQDEKKLHEKQMEFIKEKEKFEEDKKIHKQKSRNLLERENKIFIKESMKSCHQELQDISLSLSEVIDLIENIDPIIEERISQTIIKLNHLYRDNENVIIAEAI